jgi:outer membrane assembly lipoprotein YfiO
MIYYIAIFSLLMLTGCGRELPVKAKKLPTREQKHAENANDSWKSKYVKDMTYEELKLAKDSATASGNHENAVDCLNRMIILGTDLHELQYTRIELADTLFESGELEDAEKKYKEFLALYPNSEHVEYARYRTVLCCFYQTLDADRDQSKTKESVKLSQEFLKNEKYQQFAQDVRTIQTYCTDQLFDSEARIFAFYLEEQKDVVAAQRRLDDIKEQFSTVKRLAPLLLDLECKLAQAQGNTALFFEKQATLAKMNQDAGITVAHAEPKQYAAQF